MARDPEPRDPLSDETRADLGEILEALRIALRFDVEFERALGALEAERLARSGAEESGPEDDRRRCEEGEPTDRR